MAMTFAQVKTEVQSWLLDLPSGAVTRIDGWVNEAIKDAARRYNFRCMEAKIADQQTALNTRLLVARPADWKESRSLPFYVNQDGSTREIGWGPSESDLHRSYADRIPQETSASAVDNGSPRYLLENQLTETTAQIDVYPLPDQLSGWANGNYRITIPYWKFPATLSTDGETNFFTQNNEFYVIFKACALGFAWSRDVENSVLYETKAEIFFQKLKNLDKKTRLGDRTTLAAHKNAYDGRSRTLRED